MLSPSWTWGSWSEWRSYGHSAAELYAEHTSHYFQPWAQWCKCWINAHFTRASRFSVPWFQRAVETMQPRSACYCTSASWLCRPVQSKSKPIPWKKQYQSRSCLKSYSKRTEHKHTVCAIRKTAETVFRVCRITDSSQNSDPGKMTAQMIKSLLVFFFFLFLAWKCRAFLLGKAWHFPVVLALFHPNFKNGFWKEMHLRDSHQLKCVQYTLKLKNIKLCLKMKGLKGKSACRLDF